MAVWTNPTRVLSPLDDGTATYASHLAKEG